MDATSVSTQRPDVAFFLPGFAGGGAERVAVDLATEFARVGYRVDFVVLQNEGPLAGLLPPSVRVVDLHCRRMALALPSLLSYARRHRPRSLLSTLEHSNTLVLMASPWLRGTRVVIREANTASLDTRSGTLQDRLVYAAMKLTYPSARRVIAVSEGVAAELRTALHVRRERIRVIVNPVLTPRMFEQAALEPRHPWLSDAGPAVVLAAGRLEAQKGFDTLLRAFASARVRVPCRLIILGEGSLRRKLQVLAQELDVESSVDLVGYVDNPFAFMARTRAFVLSSSWEGLPNVLIQALALGAPVVATDCRSGPREILDGGRFGRLVPVGDVLAMGDAIVRVLEDRAVAVPTGWTDQYRVERVAAEYAEVLGLGTPA
jgi:glycosyltransferase involved in cell wall biosynthesis